MERGSKSGIMDAEAEGVCAVGVEGSYAMLGRGGGAKRD